MRITAFALAVFALDLVVVSNLGCGRLSLFDDLPYGSSSRLERCEQLERLERCK